MRLFDPLPSAQTLSIMPTFQCNAACTNCGTLSSPANKVKLNHEALEDAIRQGAAADYKVVVFTGGEPTLAGQWLFHGIRLAKDLGLITRVVTNAWWGKTREQAQRTVQRFTDAGLDEINFSTGDQHVRFVPLQKVIRALRASVEARLRAAIMIETVKRRTVTKEMLEGEPEVRALRDEFPSAAFRINESPWMPLDPNEIETYPRGVAINKQNLASRDGCDSVLATTTLEADGTIGACCGIGMKLIPELQMGNIADTPIAEASRRADVDFLKRWIRLEGPERILDWASSHDPEIKWENMYAHRCQACIRMYQDPRVRQVIRDHHLEKLHDVVFGEWLLFQFTGAQNFKEV